VSLYERLAELPVRVEGYELARRELELASGWTRVTTVITLHGAGERGSGEDVTYEAELHDDFPSGLQLRGATLGEVSLGLDGQALFGVEPERHDYVDYRRWGVESALLDLALRQAGRSLGEVIGREYRPVRFVVSTRASIEAWLAHDPSLEFKVDLEADWDRALMERLYATGSVRTVDMKAYYLGTVVETPRDPALYRGVVEAFPDAVIEDAWIEGECREALRGAEERLSFDAPVHSLADLDALAIAPRWMNIKPSRFGTLRRLLECIEACDGRGIRMYGGGQTELGPGRRHIQVLASLLYPDTPNDVAPGVYNAGEARGGLPSSPLPPPAAVGF
jgi:L-alanine-DL-glutamate epimerase-like enolase superfamily enzyme